MPCWGTLSNVRELIGQKTAREMASLRDELVLASWIGGDFDSARSCIMASFSGNSSCAVKIDTAARQLPGGQC